MGMQIERESIQPGWMVFDRNGQEVGKVIRADQASIRVKKGGLLGGEMSLPTSSVTEVETGRVEIDMTESEAKALNR